MVLSPKLNDLCRSVSLSVHCDKRKEKDRLFVALKMTGGGQKNQASSVRPRSPKDDDLAVNPSGIDASLAIAPSVICSVAHQATLGLPKTPFNWRRPAAQDPRSRRACASSRHKGRRTPRSARSG